MVGNGLDKCPSPPTQTSASNSSSAWWQIIHWIVGGIGLSALLPLVLWQIWHQNILQRERKRLFGKVVLITGASSGLGEALAHVFYRAGCKVILSARRSVELERVKMNLMATEVSGPVYPPVIVLMDLADLKSLPSVAKQAIGIYNGIDILINNGGISVRANALEASLDIDLKVMTVNYFGAVALTKLVATSMIHRGHGHIVFISSVQGKIALPQRSAYSASKHAMQAFADSLRAEVSTHGLKVTCISPGYIVTQLSMNALDASGEKHGVMDATTAGGMSADDCARRILNVVLTDGKDVMICDWQAHLAYLIRFCCPRVYFWLMEKRAAKLNASK